LSEKRLFLHFGVVLQRLVRRDKTGQRCGGVDFCLSVFAFRPSGGRDKPAGSGYLTYGLVRKRQQHFSIAPRDEKMLRKKK
jgi:hypothetical protein